MLWKFGSLFWSGFGTFWYPVWRDVLELLSFSLQGFNQGDQKAKWFWEWLLVRRKTRISLQQSPRSHISSAAQSF